MRGFLKNRPWSWVGTLYFAEAVPYFMVNGFFILLLSQLGYPDSTVALWTALATWPWVIKPFWAPLLDVFGTKRRWIILFQALIAAMLIAAALAIGLPDPLIGLVMIFTVIAFSSSSHDIAADGFYIEGLSQEDQALYCGFRSTFYRIGNVAVQGGLLMLVGLLTRYVFSENPLLSWSAGAAVAAGAMALLAIWHALTLPRPAADAAVQNRRRDRLETIFRELGEAFVTFFRKRGVVRVLIFILLFRLAEAMLVVMSKLFLVGDPSRGGLGLEPEQYGLLYGVVGVICLIAGGIVSGYVIYRFGLGRCMLPMALALNLPDLAYVLLAYGLPQSQWLIGTAIGVEQLGYGFGFTAFTLLMVSFAEDSGRFKTSHFAFMTGFMALGMMLPMLLAGQLSDFLGYKAFFWLVMGCTIPSILVTRLVKPCYRADFGRRKSTGE